MNKNNEQNYFLIYFLLIFLPIFLISCTPADNSWERVQTAGVLRVGLDPTFPPFENADTGELHGLDVDLAQTIGQELGVEVQFSYFGYDGLYDGLYTDQVDVLISALVIDPTRTKDFAYSEPYFNAGQVLVSPAANPLINVGELTGRVVAVEVGSEGHVQATLLARQYPNLTIRTLPTPDDALWVVLQGEAAGAIVDQVSGRLYLQQHPGLVIASEPITVEPYAVVVRQSDQNLLTQLNLALEKLEKTGRLAEITGRWLDTP